MTTRTMEEKTQVKSGDWVVLHMSDDKKVLGNVTSTSTARIGRRKRKLGNILGHRWGQNFRVCDDDMLKPVSDRPAKLLSDESAMISEKDNRNLQDTNANQSLEQDAIKALRDKGVKGEKLVQTVAKHSMTFKGKTAFSQDKYLKKKRAKFDLHVRITKPTAASLCDVYMYKSPDKTMNLRCDSLAFLMSYSGVRAGARVLIYENCIGLITGAVAERLGGHGVALNLFSSHTPPGVELLRMLNLPPDHNRAIVHTPIQLLEAVDISEPIDDEPIKYLMTSNTNGTTTNDCNGTTTTIKQPQANNDNISSKRKNSDFTPEHQLHPQSSNKSGVYEPNPMRAEAIALRPKRGIIKQWLKDGCDCLIVATRYDVVKVFDTILKYLAPSGCFAAYCTHLQDAADLHYALQLSRMATRVELWESTLVHHQVLPGRTHPEMTDSATGGYIVTGIRIDTKSNLDTSF